MKYVLLIFSLLMMTACDDSKSYEYYMLHPNYTKQISQKCSALTDAKLPAYCELATRAMQKLEELRAQAMMDPLGFGARLLKSQESLASVKIKLSKADANSKQELLRRQRQLQTTIEARLHILGSLGEGQ